MFFLPKHLLLLKLLSESQTAGSRKCSYVIFIFMVVISARIHFIFGNFSTLQFMGLSFISGLSLLKQFQTVYAVTVSNCTIYHNVFTITVSNCISLSNFVVTVSNCTIDHNVFVVTVSNGINLLNCFICNSVKLYNLLHCLYCNSAKLYTLHHNVFIVTGSNCINLSNCLCCNSRTVQFTILSILLHCQTVQFIMSLL